MNKSDRKHIQEKHLKSLSNLFRGHDIIQKQAILDCPYDFSIIPIELISNIYEIFLEKDDSKSFYTPLFLVDYILDNTLDSRLENDSVCKILDPSCGSSVFLVESLRRIINKNLKSKGKLNNRELIDIVKNNIYGVDKNENAIYLTQLSITLTVFDYLNISEMDEFEMPDLIGKNLFIEDFFNENANFNTLDNFDLILGNPPWGNENTLHLDYCRENEIPVSGNEISQTFLIRVKDFANDKTEIAMIIPSKILYNTRASEFRSFFLSMFNLEKILELSTIRKHIFKNAVVPPCVLFYNLNKNEMNKVEHNSIKPNRLFYFLQSIVIQKLDIKYVKQTSLIKYDWIWKFLLYGNVLDFHLIKKLKRITPLKEISKQNGLIHGTGINMSSNPQYDASKYLSYDYLDAGFPKKMLRRYYIDESNISKWDEQFVNRTCDENIFEPPYVLVKKGLDSSYRCVSAFSLKQWVFKDTIVSIK